MISKTKQATFERFNWGQLFQGSIDFLEHEERIIIQEHCKVKMVEENRPSILKHDLEIIYKILMLL